MADEKSQIQALDHRTQPGLPLKPGKCATMTHDYKCNGTTTLFAALIQVRRRTGGGHSHLHPRPQRPFVWTKTAEVIFEKLSRLPAHNM